METDTKETKIDTKTQELIKGHIKNVENLVLTVLAECLAGDCKYYEVGYIARRLIQIIQESYPEMKYENPELRELNRKYFFDKLKELRDVPAKPLAEEDAREKKCLPVINILRDKILSDESFTPDEEWFGKYIDEINQLFFEGVIKHYIELLFSKTELAMEESYKKADETLWGCGKQDVTMKGMDAILKGVK
jgi:hypothetical protein